MLNHVNTGMNVIAVLSLLGLAAVMYLSLGAAFERAQARVEWCSFGGASVLFLVLATWWLSLGGGDLAWLGSMDLWVMAAGVAGLGVLRKVFRET